MVSANTRLQPGCLSLVKPACADEAVGRGFADEGKPEGLFFFVNMQMRGMCKWEEARRKCVPHALLFICSP